MAAPLDDFIAAAAAALDLPLEPDWRPAVKANLEVTLRLANVVADFAAGRGRTRADLKA